MKHLDEGEVLFVQGSGKKPYELKNSGGVISCSCPAWRNQSLKIDMRTCKHIKANVSNGAAPMPVVSSAPLTPAAASPTPAGKKPAVVKATAPPCLLAHTWDGEQDVSDWLATEKMDGVRAWWDGKDFVTRLGNSYNAPQWFKDKMPQDIVLDGELFGGNGNFQKTVSAVRKQNPVDAEWKSIKYMVFDAPEHGGTYEERVDYLLDDVMLTCPGPEDAEWYCTVVQPEVVRDNADVARILAKFEKLGFEGAMLRQPGSLYESGRSHTLLKVKSFKDIEAEVIGYEKGRGRHKGRMGAIVVRLDSGVEFSVGSGFTDKQRENPPKIGAVVTVKYQELSKDGVCRFPTFVSERDYE